MKIRGFQKITLLDYPGLVACTIFLFGCNFRCGFCYNPRLVLKDEGDLFSEEEILDFLSRRKGQLEGVCITGGEPLMTLEEDFLRKIKAMDYKIKIDTNGSFPERLEFFLKEGLVDYVAMDIKGTPKDYDYIVGVNIDLDKIEKSIKLISSLENYEFRTTIVYRFHNLEKILELSKWINSICGFKPKNYFLQGFRVNEEMIDESFKEERNVEEKFLNYLKSCCENYFENVEVRI